ncbi:MAG: tRNA guanosine(34) transglycosylase Tgt [Elusimicrobia bacterium]|nr:tRNA guanosine(34) transglycosylase Tgt [Elusimicrobiota bacterium]
MRVSFTVAASCSKTQARAGVLRTPHGDFETPAFMPVATQATVKAISSEDLDTLGVRGILANSYHLYLRPGTAVVKAAGGLHKFMGYDGMILTDSGGFQVLSLADLRTVSDEGVVFRSHIDGSEHKLTPETVVNVQAELGSDCWTTLDECPPYPATQAQADEALERTMAWTDRSVPALKRLRDEGARSLFFPILQGSLYPSLRAKAAEHMAEIPADGISIGGFMVGETKEHTWDVLAQTTGLLPNDKPRYLMGVGTPEDLWDAVALGVDMMDCVWPTRVARNGQILTRRGKYNVTNKFCRTDFQPLEPGCKCFVCKRYSRAYLGHIYRSRELLSYRLLSYHNLHVMHDIAGEIRRAIISDRFEEARKAFFETFRQADAQRAG